MVPRVKKEVYIFFEYLFGLRKVSNFSFTVFQKGITLAFQNVNQHEKIIAGCDVADAAVANGSAGGYCSTKGIGYAEYWTGRYERSNNGH